MKYEAIYTYSSEFSVRKMCKVLGLKEYAYYQWKRRWEFRETRRQDARTLALIFRRVFEDNGQIYGYRKMKRAMAEEGHILSIYKVKKNHAREWTLLNKR